MKSFFLRKENMRARHYMLLFLKQSIKIGLIILGYKSDFIIFTPKKSLISPLSLAFALQEATSQLIPIYANTNLLKMFQTIKQLHKNDSFLSSCS